MPSIVQGLKKDMERLLAPETGEERENRPPRELSLQLWDFQKDLLKQRIDKVMPIYDKLVERAKTSMGGEPGQAQNVGEGCHD